ncbi:tetratricopeptide repeat protein [Thermosipho atlanticus]|uniref:Tetratricopeptide repeat-containing protein n=1 Tax=Thermosipho atlanticus DSM 15807 TaxID=1123380 RepID=A0A1M5QM49_9BACT|nr:hypothetical protein [Thermosipho atlanticus]SHH15016.1 hypothetical protein SAMN02745199_0018 [Thermosipho atlanticus DSM 15807]
MKKVIVALMILLAILSFSLNFKSLQFKVVEAKFLTARSFHNAAHMKEVIDVLEENLQEDTDIYTLLAEAYMEYGLWGVEGEKKEEMYEKALEYAKKAIELDETNGRAYYVAGATIGRLAQFKGIVKSLFMLGDFDNYIDKAIELLDDNFYKGLAYLAKGMRYRDVPWPLNNYKKSEAYLLKALDFLPNYPNIHLELGKLYEKWGKKELAIKELNIVLESLPHPLLIKTHEEAKAEAEEILKRLK